MKAVAHHDRFRNTFEVEAVRVTDGRFEVDLVTEHHSRDPDEASTWAVRHQSLRSEDAAFRLVAKRELVRRPKDQNFPLGCERDPLDLALYHLQYRSRSTNAAFALSSKSAASLGASGRSG